MDNYIIELRNKNYLNNIKLNPDAPLQEGLKNGEWVEDVEPLMMEEGDTLICRNSFIDTKAIAEEKIIVPEDTELKLIFYHYSMNWNGVVREYVEHPTNAWTVPFTSKVTAINQQNNVLMPQSNGKPCISSNTVDNSNDFFYLKTLSYTGTKGQEIGGFKVVAVFQGLNGQVQEKVVEIPKQAESGGQTFTTPCHIVFNHTVTVPVTGRALGIYLTKNPQGVDKASNEPDLTARMDGTGRVYNNTTILGTGNGFQFTEKAFVPATKEITVTLPRGNYNPPDLCTTINSLVAKANEPVNGDTDTDYIQNNLLLGFGGTGQPNQGQNNFIEAIDRSNTGSDRYGFAFQGGEPPLGTDVPLKTQMVGASQFVLSYDAETTQRFSFDYLHMPCYSDAKNSSGSDAIVGGYCRATGWADVTGQPEPSDPQNIPQNCYQVNKNAGIMFEDLQPKAFWQDLLGFDLNKFKIDSNGKVTDEPNPKCLLNGYDMKAINPHDGSNYTINGLNATVPIWVNPVEDGVNTTGSYVGINSTFVKSKDFQDIIQLPFGAVTGQAETAFVTLGTDTLAISAGKNVLDATSGGQSFGYYLIEVSSDFENNYINSLGNFNHMTAIVSRYYTNVNYVSSSSADSIIYTHKGAPQLLSSFKCRILNPDKSLALNLGSDNTVILELIKAEKKPIKK